MGTILQLRSCTDKHFSPEVFAMKSKPDIAPNKKIPANAKISKLDTKELEKSSHHEISETADKFDDEGDDPGKEFQAGEKEGDFPPDTQMNPNEQQPDDHAEYNATHESS